MMFAHLKRYRRVIVTGPQRSGTTITARMIEADTGLTYIDEQTFRAIDVAVWRRVIRKRIDFVMQAPGMCRYVHEFGHEPDLCIVLVRRPVADIIASQKRINWNYDAFELERYGLTADDGPIAEVKYNYWDTVQKKVIDNWLEVCYNDLDGHPLWVPAGDRTNFSRRQWKRR